MEKMPTFVKVLLVAKAVIVISLIAYSTMQRVKN